MMELNEKNTKLSPPWYTIRNKINALFERDEQVTVGDLKVSNEGSYTLEIKSTNAIKLRAIEKIMKHEFDFGNVKLYVNFIYPNDRDEDTVTSDDIRVAFMNNTILSDVVDAPFGPNPEEMHVYVLFEKSVVQFYNDDISDLFGNYNGLAADIASEVFNEEDNIHYNTTNADCVIDTTLDDFDDTYNTASKF